MEERFTIARVAQIIDVSTQTLKRWYKWYENPDYEKPNGLKLPQYSTDNRGTKFFTMSAVQELIKIKELMSTEFRGCMAEYNATYQWGRRGTEILQIGKHYKNKLKKEKENE